MNTGVTESCPIPRLTHALINGETSNSINDHK